MAEHHGVFRHAGLLPPAIVTDGCGHEGAIEMVEVNSIMAQQIAQAAMEFQKQQTGHAPDSVAVVLSGDTLVVTLHGALTKAEKVLAASPEGASKVQEFHRQLFTNSSEPLRHEIKKITGVDVRESAAEIETATGTVVQAFTSGTMVQVFLLAKEVSPTSWSENEASEDRLTIGAAK